MPKHKKIYVVGKMVKKSIGKAFGNNITVDFSTFEDGACGVLIAFYNKKKAKKFAGKYEIITMEEEVHENS